MHKPPEDLWNERYATGNHPTHPSRSLVEFSHLLPTSGRALDLPCGAGRNTFFLARRGLEVDAWDISAEGLRIVQETAARDPALQGRVHPRRVDAEAPGFVLPAGHWDLIVVCNYLHRPLLPQLKAAVRPGGWIFYEAILNLGPQAGRHRPEHILQPGELPTYFSGWEIAVSREEPARSRALVIARRPLPGGSGQ